MQSAGNLAEKNVLLECAQKFMLQGEYQKAIECGKELLFLNDKDCKALCILAKGQMHLGNYDAALAFVTEIKKVDSMNIGASITEAYVYKKRGQVLSEIELLQKIIAYAVECKEKEETLCYSKSLSEVWEMLGSAYAKASRPEDAREAFLTSSRVEQDERQRIRKYSKALFISNYIEKFPVEKMQKMYNGYQEFFETVRQYCHFAEAKGKIRVGYIASSLRWNLVTGSLYSLLANFSSDKFEVYCYANNAVDNMPMQMKKIPVNWRDIFRLDEEATARLIYTDGIDILVDLLGHAENNFLPVLARKPAPVQISGIGYSNSTGLKAVDYFLSDVYCDPVGMDEAEFTEKLLRLPHSHVCYIPSATMPECTGAPVCERGYITFGSFNDFNKTTNQMLLLWLDIMGKVPDCRLLLKSSYFNSLEGKQATEERLQDLGFDLERVELREFSADYLSQYKELDIALDTFPCTGCTTTCEALYMGVPVITLQGDRHGSRLGSSLLINAGFLEFVAKDEKQYVEKAVAIAFDVDLLDGLHKNLRKIMQQSDIMNAPKYVVDMENVYAEIWQIKIQQQKEEKITEVDAVRGRTILDECICKSDFLQAEKIAKNLLQVGTDDKDVLEKLTCIYIETEQQQKAENIVARLSAVYPNDGYGLFLAARVDYMSDSWELAIEKSKKALQFSQITQVVRSMLHNLLGNCYKNLGDSAASVVEYLNASKYSVDNRNKAVDYSNYLFNLHYLPHIHQEDLYKAHVAYNEFFSNINIYQHIKKERSSKIKIGYISPDMRYHVVIFFSYTLFKNYDKSLFYVTCYAKCAEDSVSQNIAGLVDRWRNISAMDDAAAAKCIYEDQIDILVDLSGHTRNNCLPILAYKPAPVQISGIGYFDTTGLSTIDYFLADIYTDPVGENDEYFTEKLFRLNHSHFCYVPSDMMPACSPPACHKNGYVTFGSFNNFTKITDDMLCIWKQILEQVPRARLILKSKIFGTPAGCLKVEQRLKKIGLSMEYIEFRPETFNYLEEYADIDIALDTFPYPGGGTTCDALYMGVPVITLVGKRHGSRFGYSLLKNVGLDEFCAFSERQYVEIAVSLARDKKWLFDIHTELREKMKKSALMDGNLYMEEVEKMYLRVWIVNSKSDNFFKGLISKLNWG